MTNSHSIALIIYPKERKLMVVSDV